MDVPSLSCRLGHHEGITGGIQPLWMKRMSKSFAQSHHHPSQQHCLLQVQQHAVLGHWQLTLPPAVHGAPGADHAPQPSDALSPGHLLHTHPQLTLVPAHVNELPGHTGRTQCPFDNGLGGSHESVDSAVGGGTSIHVQQHTARRPGDGLCQCIDHLPDGRGGEGS